MQHRAASAAGGQQAHALPRPGLLAPLQAANTRRNDEFLSTYKTPHVRKRGNWPAGTLCQRHLGLAAHRSLAQRLPLASPLRVERQQQQHARPVTLCCGQADGLQQEQEVEEQASTPPLACSHAAAQWLLICVALTLHAAAATSAAELLPLPPVH